MCCAAMGMATGGLVWGRVSDRIDPRLLLAMGGICQVLPLAVAGRDAEPLAVPGGASGPRASSDSARSMHPMSPSPVTGFRRGAAW